MDSFPIEKITRHRSQMYARSQRTMYPIYGTNNIWQTNNVTELMDDVHQSMPPRCMDVPLKQYIPTIKYSTNNK
jgi:hypothetical protein